MPEPLVGTEPMVARLGAGGVRVRTHSAANRGERIARLALVLGVSCGPAVETTSLPSLVTAIEPECADTASATPITIRGTMPVKPVVSLSASSTIETGYRAWLGDDPSSNVLTDVRWVDAETLVATVPPGIGPGEYVLTIESPFAERSTAAFRVSAGPCNPKGAILVISADAAPANVTVGLPVVVGVTVRNGGDAAAKGVTTAVTAPLGFELLTSPTGPMDIGVGDTRTFTWTFRTSAGAGRGKFAIDASGVDATSGGQVFAPRFTTAEVAALYSVGGTVLNLPSGGAVVLQLNGANDSTMTRNGAFSFAGPLSSGTEYKVSVASAPAGHTCRVNAGAGQVTTRNVDEVQVNCDPNSMSLAIAVNGSGAVHCDGASCALTYPYGTLVNVTATPTVGWSFGGWTGDCAGGSACSVTMSTDHSVSAVFALNTYPLSVSIVGMATITASPSPPALTCTETACSGSYQHGTRVVLYAAPGTGYGAATWSGSCVATTATTCEVEMLGARSVTATFSPNRYALVVDIAGSGTIAANPRAADWACNDVRCMGSYQHGARVALTATPWTGYGPVAWAGDCATITGGTCEVSLLDPRNVTATFAAVVP